MTLTTDNKLYNSSIVLSLAILAALFSIGLVSACSGTQTSQPNAAQNNTGTLPATPTLQTPQTSAAGSTGSSTNAPAQVMAAPSAPAVAVSPGQEHLAGIGSATVITIHGKIVSVNRGKKLVTLEGPSGKQITVHVYNPYNLAEAEAGEPFIAKFYEIVTIVKKKPSASIPAASLTEGIVSAVPGQTPGAAFGTQLQVVATIDAINEDLKTVALKGPDGAVETVKVANPANLKHVKVGDQIVITLSNVVAITLEKESAS